MTPAAAVDGWELDALLGVGMFPGGAELTLEERARMAAGCLDGLARRRRDGCDWLVIPTESARRLAALLRALARECLEHGYARLEWSVLDWNEPAIRFYEAAGADALDEWTGYRMSRAALEAFAAGDQSS